MNVITAGSAGVDPQLLDPGSRSRYHFLSWIGGREEEMSKKAESDGGSTHALMKELAGHDAEAASLLGDLGSGLGPNEDPLYVDIERREPARPAGPPEPVTYVEPRVPPAPTDVKTFEMETVKRTDTVRDLAIMKRDTLRGLNSGAPGAEESPPSSGPSPVVVPSVKAEATTELEVASSSTDATDDADPRKVTTQRKLPKPPQQSTAVEKAEHAPAEPKRQTWLVVASVLVILAVAAVFAVRSAGVTDPEVPSDEAIKPTLPAESTVAELPSVAPATRVSGDVPVEPTANPDASVRATAATIKLPRKPTALPPASSTATPVGPDPKREVPF